MSWQMLPYFFLPLPYFFYRSSSLYYYCITGLSFLILFLKLLILAFLIPFPPLVFELSSYKKPWARDRLLKHTVRAPRIKYGHTRFVAVKCVWGDIKARRGLCNPLFFFSETPLPFTLFIDVVLAINCFIFMRGMNRWWFGKGCCLRILRVSLFVKRLWQENRETWRIGIRVGILFLDLNYFFWRISKENSRVILSFYMLNKLICAR